MAKAKRPQMSADAALSWVRYEQRKQALADAIRAGKVPAGERQARLDKIAAECGV